MKCQIELFWFCTYWNEMLENVLQSKMYIVPNRPHKIRQYLHLVPSTSSEMAKKSLWKKRIIFSIISGSKIIVLEVQCLFVSYCTLNSKNSLRRWKNSIGSFFMFKNVGRNRKSCIFLLVQLSRKMHFVMFTYSTCAKFHGK